MERSGAPIKDPQGVGQLCRRGGRRGWRPCSPLLGKCLEEEDYTGAAAMQKTSVGYFREKQAVIL